MAGPGDSLILTPQEIQDLRDCGRPGFWIMSDQAIQDYVSSQTMIKIRKAERQKTVETNQRIFEGKIWKTITLGQYKTALDYRRAIEKSDEYYLEVDARRMLSKISISKRLRNINLIVRSVRQLGFTKPTLQRVVYSEARKWGLSLCPAEVGPALRLCFGPKKFQPNALVIAMKPIMLSATKSLIFCLWQGGSRRCYLEGVQGDPKKDWLLDPEYRFVFMIPSVIANQEVR